MLCAIMCEHDDDICDAIRIILCHGARSLVPLEPLDILSHENSISEDQTASRRRAFLGQQTQSGHQEQMVRMLPPEEQQPEFD